MVLSVYCSIFEAELADVIPVVKTSIGDTRIIGRLCAGENSDVLLVLCWKPLHMLPPLLNESIVYFCRKQKWASRATHHH